jgi:CRP-like cAMP-binding protein
MVLDAIFTHRPNLLSARFRAYGLASTDCSAYLTMVSPTDVFGTPTIVVVVSDPRGGTGATAMDARTLFGKSHFLSRLSPIDIAELQPSLKKIPMVQGTVLHPAGSPIEHVYFPLSGMISLLVVMETGQQIETGIIGSEGLAGGSIGNSGPSSFGQATVQIGGSASQITSPQFMILFNKSADFRKLVNEFQSVLFFQSQQSSACHAVHSVEARLCRWILQCQDVTGLDVIELTQEFISDMLGVQRNAVSLCAHALQQAGLISYSRGSIKILNRAGLKESACECYKAIYEYVDNLMPLS